MTSTPPPATGDLASILQALADARNMLTKTATGRIDSNELTVPRAAFDSAVRNIDKARETLRARAATGGEQS